MRQHFAADWAYGIRGALEAMVKPNCPQLLRSWPLLTNFQFEAYLLPSSYMLLVLRDKLIGTPAALNMPQPFPHDSVPALPPRIENIALWQFFVRDTLNLSQGDASFLIPIHDSGRNDASADFGLFSPEERHFWNKQLTHVYDEQKKGLEFMLNTPVSNVTYNVTGPNSRVSVNSHDSSQNIVHAGTGSVFGQLRDLLAQIPQVEQRAEIAASIDAMEQNAGQRGFVREYQRFIGLSADHAGLFGAVLPALAALLGS